MRRRRFGCFGTDGHRRDLALKDHELRKRTDRCSGIDLSEITGFVKRNPSYAAWFLGEVFREKELNKIYYYSYGRDADYWNAQNLVSGGNAKRLPNLVLYGFVIFGYLVIAGPGLYLMLKRKGLNRYYGGSLLVFSAAACVVIWAMGGKTRFTSEFCTSATILDAEKRYRP